MTKTIAHLDILLTKDITPEMAEKIGRMAYSMAELLMTRRQSIIMELGAIEDYLDMPRSIVPRRKREHGCRCEDRKAS